MENNAGRNSLAQIDLTSILKDVVRQWWVILLFSLSAALFANVWVSWSYQPEYTVTSTFVVTSKGMNNNIYQNLSSAKTIAERFTQILDSNVLKNAVAEDLGMDSFTATTSATVLDETNLVELEVTAGSAKEAYYVMRSIMANYSTVSDYVIENVILEVLQSPSIPSSPSNSADTRHAMKLAFAGMAAVAALGFAVLSYMKDTVKNEREVLEKVDARFLGAIFRERKVKSLRDIRKSRTLSMLISNPMLSFRFVESNKKTAARVRSRLEKKEAKTLLVTSVMENEGKSTVAANLALALAQEGKQVLLVDCDFRKPAQYKIFGIAKENTVDLPGVITGKKAEGNLIRRWNHSSLYLLLNSASLSDSEELSENRRLKAILDTVRKRMDYVIVDSSPLALVADTEEIAQIVDATVLVIRQDMVLAKDINDSIDILNRAGGNVLGCILNEETGGIFRGTGYGYGGHYGYGHYGYGGHYGKRTE